MTDIHQEQTALFIRGLPCQLKQDFKLECLRHGITMTEAVRQLMQQVIKGKVNLEEKN